MDKDTKIIHLGKGFWNIRGSFKVAGLVDIGTQASLVKLQTGDYIFLDACELLPQVKNQIDQLTDDGKLVKAILNLHPFHTGYVEKMHQLYPDAELYGTSRHLEYLSNLPWQELCTEDPELHAMFAEDLAFSVPAGVDFVSSNKNVHFASVLVFHRASKTIHVDDTLMLTKLPGIFGAIGFDNVLNFHPTLPMALQKRPGAADEFAGWAKDLIANWSAAENLCAAHSALLLNSDKHKSSVKERLQRALRNIGWILTAHRLRYDR